MLRVPVSGRRVQPGQQKPACVRAAAAGDASCARALSAPGPVPCQDHRPEDRGTRLLVDHGTVTPRRLTVAFSRACQTHRKELTETFIRKPERCASSLLDPTHCPGTEPILQRVQRQAVPIQHVSVQRIVQPVGTPRARRSALREPCSDTAALWCCRPLQSTVWCSPWCSRRSRRSRPRPRRSPRRATRLPRPRTPCAWSRCPLCSAPSRCSLQSTIPSGQTCPSS